MNSSSSSALSEAARLLKSIPSALFLFDINANLRFSNPAARALPAIADQEIPDLSALERAMPLCSLDGKSVPAEHHPVRAALRGEAVPTTEYYSRRINAMPVWVECEAQAIHGHDGEMDGVILTCRNISDRKRREQAVEAKGKVQEFFYNENLAGILHSTIDGRILHVNDAIVRMLGYESRKDLETRRTPQIYWEPAERDEILRLLSRQGRVDEIELRLRRKDGAMCWGLASIRLIQAGVDEIGGDLVSSIIDITQRKVWEEFLRLSERRFSDFMRNLPGVAFIKDLHGRYTYYNEASQRLFGIDPNQIVGKTDEEVWPAENASHFRVNDAQVVKSRQPVEILEAVPHGSKTHSWLINKFPIIEDDKVVAVGGVGIDVTERLQLEDQLTQARKMEALGRLAGGVAHDFNNLLTVISGYSQLALEGIGRAPADKLTAYVQEILNSSRRASGLTNQLLAFSRRQNIQLKVVDLCELLRNMDRLLQRMIGEHVELHVRCSQEPCPVRADVNQLEQVVMNLSVNARDAMPLGGILDIECSLLPAGSSAEAQNEVLLLVRDTGVGMDDQVRSKLFEPFFTSKEKGKGTGLGLSTVYGIVKQAGGRVEVETAPGAGACFRVYLPAAESEAAPVSAIPAPFRGVAGTETILLVEDELSVRELAREILKRLGYKVLLADSGKSAMDIWDREFGKIDLLLTDVIMPHMSGGELAHRLRERNPRLRVLFMSGYTDDMLASHGALDGGTQLIPKPFTAEALGRKLRELLED